MEKNQPEWEKGTNIKSGSQRSREFRERKKKFMEENLKKLEDLELEVKTLRWENKSLKSEIKQLKRKVNSSPNNPTLEPKNPKFDHTLHEYEDYVYNTLGPKMSSNPDEVRFTTLAQATEHIRDWR